MFAGWRLFFERLAVTGPVVLLVEDAQYADTALLDFVDHLTDWARNAPIYVVVFGRQELIDQRPGFGVGRNRSLVALDLLDSRSMDDDGRRARARACLPTRSRRSPRRRKAIRCSPSKRCARSSTAMSSCPRDGRYVLVGDVLDLGVPDSLHGLLAARLDALDPEARSLLADAAVLGTSFPSEALVAVSGRPADEVETILADLVRRGVLEISADPLSPQSGAYVFAQNLLRQVAYDTVSRRERKARHLAVAAHLQVTFDGDEIMDVVARHYLDALACVENDVDDDEIRAKACDALVRAAEHASATGAPRRASAQFARVAELVAESAADPGEAAALWERAAGASRTGGVHDVQYQHAERARELYLRRGHARARPRGQRP